MLPRIRTLCIVVCFGCWAVTASTPARAAERANVLWISVDDLNDWVGPLGGHPQTKTPHLDRLAERGVTFANAHCNVPICSPSRTSFMTGVQPFRSKVLTNGDALFDLEGRFKTLPEHLAGQGYRTLGAGKLFHGSGGRYADLFDRYGPDSGNQGGPFTKEELDTQKQNPTHEVDRGDGGLKAVLPMNNMPDDRRNERSRNNSFDWGPVNVATAEMPDGMVADWAVDRLAEPAGDGSEQPFFLGVGFYRPHQPLFAPEKYFQPFPESEIRLPATSRSDLDDLSPYATKLARFPLTAGSHATVVRHDQWHAAVAGYLACVHFVDDLIGRVVDGLDASSHAENTWIIVFSDHGYHLGEKEHWGKFTTWQRSTRVPLIVVPPKSAEGFRRGVRVDAAVSLVDLFPTVVDVCDLNAPAHALDGDSLRPFLDGSASRDQVEGRVAITTVGRGSYSIRSNRYRYVHYFDGSEELYDHATDPNEWNNLAEEAGLRPVRRTMKRHLPDEPEVARYVRYGDWKAVLFDDAQTKPILYPIQPGTGSGGGIGETANLADRHPEVLRAIREALRDVPADMKHVTLSPN